MPPKPERNEDPESEPEQLTLDFDRGRFTTAGEADRREWVATAICVTERRESTRNTISLILVVAFVAAFPAYALALHFLPELKQEVMTGFAQWLAVIGSLTGAAVGVGATADRRNS